MKVQKSFEAKIKSLLRKYWDNCYKIIEDADIMILLLFGDLSDDLDKSIKKLSNEDISLLIPQTIKLSFINRDLLDFIIKDDKFKAKFS